MTNLDAAIRARLAEYDDSMYRTGSLWGTEDMQAALLAVLDLHQPVPFGTYLGDRPPTDCSECVAASGVNESWPCPTVRAIAAALGVGTNA
jgi:hypothetical protein